MSLKRYKLNSVLGPTVISISQSKHIYKVPYVGSE